MKVKAKPNLSLWETDPVKGKGTNGPILRGPYTARTSILAAYGSLQYSIPYSACWTQPQAVSGGFMFQQRKSPVSAGARRRWD